MLILISGLPGSGKTTLARAFSTQKKVLHLNSDLLRRDLGLLGNYGSADKQKVYSTLLERTENALLAGETVVVDSTFYKKDIRAPFQKLAEKCRVPIRWVEVRAQESTIRERLKTPRPDSEADFLVYEKIRDAAEPIAGPHLVLWSDVMDLDEMVTAVLRFTENLNA